MWGTEAYAALNKRLDAVLGGRTAAPFEALGVSTVGHLLHHVPRRYLRGAEDSRLRDLQVGEDAVFIAHVESATEKLGSRHRVEVVVTDGTARAYLTFFVPPKGGRWFPQKVLSTLHPGVRGLFFGKVGAFQNKLQLTHPDYVTLDESGAIIGGAKRNVRMGELASRAGFIGIYPATAKLPTWTVAQSVQLARELVGELPEPLPSEVREAVDVIALARADPDCLGEPREGTHLPELATAVEWVHRPLDLAQAWLGRQRFLFDEAFAVQATMAYRREATKQQPATPRTVLSDGLLASFDERLPFALTAGQQQVSAEIFRDLERPHPMQRLLQGEVGSGKTLVALRAMLAIVDSGGQAVLLAPTEVLAQQHYRTILAQLGELARGGGLLGPAYATSVALLTGSLTAAATRAALLEIASGSAGIVIGTHALLSDRVQFADLGLVVVDEQHRFGVEQRAALNEKAATRPHILVMTATPIPRTVAMTIFGDLEVSTLAELPAGRSEVKTMVVAETVTPDWVRRAWERVAEEVAAGRQAFIVCPQITPTDTSAEAARLPAEGSEEIEPRNVTELFEELVAGPLAGLRVEMLHGQLAADQKEQVMRRFAEGAVDVLIATTVIEVGVNVPNASVMVISDADRFGISQLHQLRGRIGRGSHAGLCLLLTKTAADSVAADRLRAVAGTRDGFELAEVDLAQRREGDVLGSAQAGVHSSLKLLRALDHVELIRQARAIADECVRHDPELARPGVADAVRQLNETAAADWLTRG